MRKRCLEVVHRLAKRDERVVFVGSDLGFKTLDAFRKELPERFLVEGISEQNVVGLAAGLALEGRIPYVNTIATFLTRRALEQVAMDLCLHDLPVRLIGNGGGLVYAPLGSTHLAVEDIALMRALPHMTVVCPADAEEMERFMERTLDWPHPIYIRLAKGYDPVVTDQAKGFEIGRGYTYRQGSDVLLLTTGIGLRICLEAADILAQQQVAASTASASRGFTVGSVEEHTVVGGLGSAAAELLLEAGVFRPFRRVGLPDVFPDHYGTQNALMERYGIWPQPVAERALELLAAGG